MCYRIQFILLGNLNLVLQNFQHMLVSDEVKTKVGPLCWAPLCAKNITNIWFNLQNNDMNELNSAFFCDPISWPLSHCCPVQQPAGLMMPEIHQHVLYAGPLYLLSPRSQRTFAFYSGLLKCHPLMKDFLTILSIAVLITPYPLTLLFSSGHLPGRLL